MKLLALVLFLIGSAAGADKKPADGKPSGPDEKTRIQIAEYMLKTPLNEASPAVVGPFLNLDAAALPKRLREKSRIKQLEIRTLLKIHDTKKKGSGLRPLAGCAESSFIKPTKDLPAYQAAGFEEITEGEEKAVMRRTRCEEVDLGCQFSLVIFQDAGSKKPRRLFLMANDPMMALVGDARDNIAGQNNYFGTGGISCRR